MVLSSATSTSLSTTATLTSEEKTAIAQQFAELMAQNELLAKENRLFESFLQRNANPLLELERSPKHARRAAARFQDATISDSDRTKLATEELDYRSKQLTSLSHKSQLDISLLHAITQGIQARTAQMRKEAYSFQREVCVSGVGRDGKVRSERVVKWMEDRIKEKVAEVEKLKVKNRAMKLQKAKIEAQVKQKEEQGESLHSIDFHQLQIKNSQYTQKIKEKNDQLLQLKMSTGRAVQRLNNAKLLLSEEMQRARWIKREIKERERNKVRMLEEMARVEEEVAKEEEKRRKFMIVQSNPDMPSVMDYVLIKKEMYELEKEKLNWERKIEILMLDANAEEKRRAQSAPSVVSAGAGASVSVSGGQAARGSSLVGVAAQHQQHQQHQQFQPARSSVSGAPLPRVR